MVSKRLKRITFTNEEIEEATATMAGLTAPNAPVSRRARRKAGRAARRRDDRRAGRDEVAPETWREAIARAERTEDIDEIVELTAHPDPRVRVAALHEVCPCQVKGNIEAFWDRVLAMTEDPSLAVRKQVLHTMLDGSPAEREHEVVTALREMSGESDRDTRRMVNKALTSWERTGLLNIL